MPIPAWTNTAAGKDEPEWEELGRQFRDCKRTFILHVQSWQKYTPLTDLDWQRLKYQSDEEPTDERGVYAFVLDSSVLAQDHFPPHVYVLYVGETGNTGNGTLKSRLINYRNIRAQMRRSRIWDILNQWGPYLQFYYAVVRQGVSTKTCETALLDAHLPPANDKDFSAVVRLARNFAFQG